MDGGNRVRLLTDEESDRRNTKHQINTGIVRSEGLLSASE